MSGVNSVRLKDKIEKILCLWEERSLKEVKSASTSASLALRDSLPLYLEHLSEALALSRKMDFKSIAAHDKESMRIGKMHGADRAGNKNYRLTEVISEYHILREVIFQVLEHPTPLKPIQRDIILDSIEQAVNDAAVKFSELHADIQQQFINTLTHDLKTPITSAKMNAEMILKLSDRPDACIVSATRIIASQNRLSAMIHDLLDASRIRAGEQLDLQFIRCDLNSVIHEVVEEMAVIHGARFIFNSPESLDGRWSRDGLRRTFENLLENAVKYGATQTPITVSVKKQEKVVEVTVHNEGQPIPENEVAHLFQQFGRSKGAQEGAKVGWGLGLTLVKGVVDAQKGKVRVESSEGKGTSFILEIPFLEVTALPMSGLRKSDRGEKLGHVPNKKSESSI